MRQRLGTAGTDLYIGRVPLVAGLRFVLWCCTALWGPVLLAPGDTTARADSYDTIRWIAAWAHLPSLTPWLYPPELLVCLLAGGCALFSAWDYLAGGSRFSPVRVWLAAIFWVGLAASYFLANPIGYGTWLFIGIALLHCWCLMRARV